jgi:hypothetical protein
MSVGNIGGVMNQLEGFLATEYANSRNHQGLAIFPGLIREVVTQANLTEANLRCTAPRLFDGTNDVDVEAAAVRLFGIVIDNTEAADNALIVYETNTVTEGTTDPKLVVEVPSSSALALVIPGGVALDALSWSACDGGTVAIEAGTLAAASSLKVMLVYAE